MSPLPLEGIRIIDLSQVMMGPIATQLLGDFGADVIKVERPSGGDIFRWAVTDPDGPDHPAFCSVNRNKRSIAVDVRAPAGLEVVYELVRTGDMVVSNYRPGVMERLGLGYDQLRGINPQIIVAEGSGFGSSGPYVHKGGQDIIAQAYTGTMARKADPSHPLSIYATSLADYSAGMHLVQGLLLALLARERTGEGQHVAVSLYDSMLGMQTLEAAVELMRGEEMNWAALPLNGVFETSDGALVLVGAFRENPLKDICAALRIEDLSSDERYDTPDKQAARKPELQTIFRERFATDTTARWLESLEAQDLLCGPVKHLADALTDAQTHHNEMVIEFDHPKVGTVRSVASPIHLAATPAAIRHPSPTLGEHTDEILSELGYGEAQRRELRDAGVIA